MLIIVEDQLGSRLDQYLAAQLPELSRARIQALIKEGEITVNSKSTKAKTPVERGMRIEVNIPEPEPAEALPQDIPISVLYEDRHVIVIDKESGMVVHPAAGNPDGTLVNAVLFHCGDLSADLFNSYSAGVALTKTFCPVIASNSSNFRGLLSAAAGSLNP